jgi:hypothetical protein
VVVAAAVEVVAAAAAAVRGALCTGSTQQRMRWRRRRCSGCGERAWKRGIGDPEGTLGLGMTADIEQRRRMWRERAG